MEPRLQELPPPRGSLPFISEETRQQLLEELGLQVPLTTARVLEGITGERQTTRPQLVRDMTQNIFADIMDVNRPLAEEVNKSTIHLLLSTTDSRLGGMAIVIRAYDLDLEHNLIPRFANLGAEDIGIINETLKRNTDRLSILQILLNMPRIPEQQATLNSIVKEASGYAMLPGELIIGAGQMYALLSRWWPKLFPNQTPGQPPTADLA